MESNDKCVAVFGNAGGGVTAQFESEEEPIHIIFSPARVEDFPKELLPSPECKIEVKEYTSRSVNVSCPVGGK